MFPLSIEGAFDVDVTGVGPDACLDRITELLVQNGSLSVARGSDDVYFKAGLFHTSGLWSWSVLLPVGSGLVTVAEGVPMTVTYKLSTVELAVITSVLVAAMSGWMLASGTDFVLAATFAVLGLSSLLGGSYAIAAMRLPTLLRRAVASDTAEFEVA